MKFEKYVLEPEIEDNMAPQIGCRLGNIRVPKTCNTPSDTSFQDLFGHVIRKKIRQGSQELGTKKRLRYFSFFTT